MIKNRTLDDYKKAGAWMRLLKAVLAETYMECSKVLKAKDTDSLESAIRRVDAVCSKAEDNMFGDFPELSNQYIDVFYGTPNISTTDVDKEQIALMRKLVKELFEDN